MDKVFTMANGDLITVRLNESTKTFTINNSRLDEVFYSMSHDNNNVIKTDQVIWDHWFDNDKEKQLEVANWYFEVVNG